MGLTDTSKFLSLILRHKPETIGIKLDEHGWADVSELISGISKTRPFDMKILIQQLRWAAGMESLWCIGWQPERWQMKDLSFSYL